MDYKKTLELLLKEEALTKKEAFEILKFWSNNSRAYYSFLRRKGMSRNLYKYAGADEEMVHFFEKMDVRVPASEIAHKFFALKDDDIFLWFMDVIGYYGAKKMPYEEVCAFPYLQRENLKLLSDDAILNIIKKTEFVFDFADDADGSLFRLCYNAFTKPEQHELLALNSFNILNWAASKFRDFNEQLYAAKLFMISNHAFPQNNDEEAWFRKSLIRFNVEVSFGYERVCQEMNKIVNKTVYN